MTPARVALWIGIALIVATLANGGATWLRRVGWVDSAAYSRYLDAYCAQPLATQRRFWTDCACVEFPDDSRAGAYLSERAYLYRDEGVLRALKLAKDALVGLVVAGALLGMATRRAPIPSVRGLLPLAPLAVCVALGFGLALARFGPPFALAGLRGFGFLALGAVCGFLVPGFATIAWCLAGLVLIQGVAVLVELVSGIPIRACPHSFRALGTLVMPNTLGIFCVGALGFSLAFAPSPWRVKGVSIWPGLIGVAVIVLLASGSATGLLALFALMAFAILARIAPSKRSVAGGAALALGAAICVALPAITQRPDLFRSVFASGGRIDKLGGVVHTARVDELLIGRGLGYGSNSAASIAEHADSGVVLPSAMPSDLDSTVGVLVAQIGVLGLCAFYGLLGWAALRDRRGRPAYLVLGLCSLTTSIGEAFPLNFLLGLCLAHAAQARSS